MYTNTSLENMIPEIKRNLSKLELRIGSNEYCLDQDGWCISFDFDFFAGDFGSRGKVYDLSVEYYDEEKEEEKVFSESDISIFRKHLESILSDLA